MTAPTDKAAPIPAEVEKLAAETVLAYAVAPMIGPHSKHLAGFIAQAIMQDRADRASQEERIREDARTNEGILPGDRERARLGGYEID